MHIGGAAFGAALDEKWMGQRVQELRRGAGMTQQELCQKAGLSYSTLAKIERGAIKSPSIFTIQHIAKALGTTLDVLMDTSSVLPTKQRQHSKSGVTFVYFDINGCLVRFYHQAFTKIGVDCDQASDVVETAFWHYNDKICRGEMTMAEFNEAMGKRLHMVAFDWVPYYLAASTPMPKVHALVEWVSKRYGIGLLSNIMPGLIQQMFERQLLPKVPYDVIIDSSQVHSLKPERDIYEIALARANCPPQEILLIDDSRTNLMAAEKLGWHVMWFDTEHPEISVDRIREALLPS